jgi:hypothetical protein
MASSYSDIKFEIKGQIGIIKVGCLSVTYVNQLELYEIFHGLAC